MLCCGMRRRLITELAAKDTCTGYRQATAADSFLLNTLRDVCHTLGATLEIEPEFNYVGRITFKNGHTTYFRHNKFDINPHASCLTATDKSYTSYFLKQSGLAVPDGLTFFSDILNPVLETKRTVDDAVAYATRLGFPVIVKPNDMSQGALVTRVNDADELRAVAAEIFAFTNVALVQPIYKGNDYRVVLLDSAVVAAYQRIPLSVTGDGESDISTLLTLKQMQFSAAGRGDVINSCDSRMASVLRSQGMTSSSVPAVGQVVRLLDNANLSTGGEAVDITDNIHPSYVAIAQQAARALNLRMAGIDFMAPDLTQPAANDYVIIEVNAAPGLRNYAAMGPVQFTRASNFYADIIRILERTHK